MNINNLAGLCAILGFIAMVVKILFFSGHKMGKDDVSLNELRENVDRLEKKTDRLSERIEELLLSVGMLQGELRRMNGRGY